MNWDQSATLLLRRVIPKFDDRSDLAPRIQDHLPRELRDLARAQAGFDGEQNDDDVSVRVPAGGGVDEEVLYISIRQYLFLLACHIQGQISCKSI